MGIVVSYIVLGILAGAFSGLIGVGGGVVIVPALVLLFHFSQQTAQGTTLALLLPPISILATYVYYKAGFVNIKAAILICVGFVVGGYFGGKFAVHLPKETLQKIFAGTLVVVGFYMLFKK